MRHIGGFLESRRDDRPQTGAQASGYDATTKEAPTERQRHRLFLSPFQGFVLLMSQSRGFHPRLWSFAPSVLHLGTAINTMNSLRDCKSLYPMRADCKSARTAADRSLLHRLLRPRPHPQPLPFKGRGGILSFLLKAGSPLRPFPSLLRGGVRGGVASAVAVPFRSSLRGSETFDPTPNPSPSRGGEGPSAFS